MTTEAKLTFTEDGGRVRVKVETTPPMETEQVFCVVTKGLPYAKTLVAPPHAVAMAALDYICEDAYNGDPESIQPIIVEHEGKEADPYVGGLEKHMDSFGVPVPI